MNSYGKDLPEPWDFADLLRELDKIDGDYLIRFMSSQPKDASHKLFDTMAQSRHVAHQLHLPVQSGSDRVLRAMNRPYDRAKYLDLIGYARKVMPDLVLTSDVIIGFPGETEAEAMETVDLVRQVEFDALFTFIFSPRPGTPAAKMDDPVPRAEKQKWFDTLLQHRRTRFLPGSTPGMWAGPCACWWTAKPTTPGGPCPPGRRGDGWCTWWGTSPPWASTGT